MPTFSTTDTTGAWAGWVCEGTTSSATLYLNDIWTGWTTPNSTIVIGATTSSLVWSGWVTANNQHVYQNAADIYRAGVLPQPTEEELAEREQRRLEAIARQAERQREEAEANQKAETLLLENLSLVQQEEYRSEKHFHVISRSGKRYRVNYGSTGNVLELVEDKPVSRFCIHPREQVPHADTMLAQKLLLETDEVAFRRIANITRMAG